MSLKRGGLLFLVVVIPSLFYIFLNTFGVNHYKSLPRYIPLEVLSKGDTIFHQIPKFSLLNFDSIELKSSDLENKIYVVNFFFTTCKSICPVMTSELYRVQEAFPKDSIVKLVSISVDPDDSVSVLKDYAKRNRVDNNQWYLLTGIKDSIYTLAKEGFKLNALEDLENVGEFIHSDKFLLIDKNKNIRGIYNGVDQKDVDRLITEIKILKKEYE